MPLDPLLEHTSSRDKLLVLVEAGRGQLASTRRFDPMTRLREALVFEKLFNVLRKSTEPEYRWQLRDETAYADVARNGGTSNNHEGESYKN